MTLPLSDELCQEALNAYVLHGGYQQGANALGVPRPTFQHRVHTARRRGLEPELTEGTAEVSRLRQNTVGLEDQVRALQTELRSLRRDNLTAEIIRKEILGLAEHSPSPPKWTIDIPKRGTDQLVPAVLWSDWHWGEVVSSEEVGGINSYDMGEAHKRAKRLLEGVLDLCFNYGPGNYPGIILCLGGDMVSGNIHEELMRTNEQELGPVLLDLHDVLIKAIETLADKFGKVFIPCVPGNHGRMTQKKPAKKVAHTNFDWLLYGFLERHFRNASNTQFLVTDDTDVAFRVYGHRFLLTHGDNLGVRGGDGIIGALGPILRGDFKTRNQQQAMRRPYDTLLMGHWHQFMPLVPRLIVNGSLKGFDEFAKLFLRAMPERPQQALWFTHPRHGIVRSEPVFVTDSDVEERADWTSWAI